ncbi:hypothetical protein [Streptomyces sp. NRRL B-24720]|uniref:hypothetical protein n=1 Tax=Streptomyces sp. NRRL B-24720 TaxID=1476876 RepID=UPI00131A7362|nr:hypothetical protein [Streptomyces sp. NRRL B-24720]
MAVFAEMLAQLFLRVFAVPGARGDGRGDRARRSSSTYSPRRSAWCSAAGPLRTRQLGQALDRPILAKHTEGIRAKLTRLVDRSILADAEPGLFTQPRP